MRIFNVRHPFKRHHSMVQGLIALALLVVSCAGASAKSPFDPQPFKLVVAALDGPRGAMQHINEAFSSPKSIKDWLNSVAPGSCAPRAFEGAWLRDCRDRFAATENGLRATSVGLTASHLDQVIFLLNSTMTASGGFGQPPNAKLTGQINKTCLSSPTQPGYYFPAMNIDWGDTFAVLCVTVTTTTAQPGVNASTDFRQFYEVHVRSPGGTYGKSGVPAPYGVARYDDTDPTDVFPEAFVHTGLKVSKATAGDFRYKLYASGRNIRVVNYWHEVGSSGWTKHNIGDPGLPPSIQRIFAVDPNACLDMMFKAPPPVTLGDLEPPAYCLGRCANPPIVNTGE